MSKQLHKRLNQEDIKLILSRYDEGAIDRCVAQSQLGIGKSRFFEIMKVYRGDEDAFTTQYTRHTPTRLTPETEKAIEKELLEEKKLIEDPELPIRFYNYSHVRDILCTDYKVTVSLDTIIRRAKNLECYKPRKKRKRIHDREVITDYVGELVQHDSSHHLWSPYASQKWYLITSLDDYSRRFLYADLVESETSWTHIDALKQACISFGVPVKYYSDQHRIFRFVAGRDSHCYKIQKKTDEVNTQWKQVCTDLGIKVTYALSPQAKGKIERPYGWLQDRIVRRCAKKKVTSLKAAQKILYDEIYQYDSLRVHSTTKEIPSLRYERSVSDGTTLMRPLSIPKPYKDLADIFCFRDARIIDAYRKISFKSVELKLSGVEPRQEVNIRFSPSKDLKTTQLRIWHREKLVDVRTVKTTDLKGVRF